MKILLLSARSLIEETSSLSDILSQNVAADFMISSLYNGYTVDIPLYKNFPISQRLMDDQYVKEQLHNPWNKQQYNFIQSFAKFKRNTFGRHSEILKQLVIGREIKACRDSSLQGKEWVMKRYDIDSRKFSRVNRKKDPFEIINFISPVSGNIRISDSKEKLPGYQNICVNQADRTPNNYTHKACYSFVPKAWAGHNTNTGEDYRYFIEPKIQIINIDLEKNYCIPGMGGGIYTPRRMKNLKNYILDKVHNYEYDLIVKDNDEVMINDLTLAVSKASAETCTRLLTVDELISIWQEEFVAKIKL
jgi:hypothetical protein